MSRRVRVPPPRLRQVATYLRWSAATGALAGWVGCALGRSDDGLHCLAVIYGLLWCGLTTVAAAALQSRAERLDRLVSR